MIDKNPFVLTFGIKPANYISRITQAEGIISSFENNTNNVYMITGLRGIGKTSFLTVISEYFQMKKDWIVIELISESDMLDQLASKLYDVSLLHRIFNGKTFGFSFQGLSFSIKGEKPLTNVLSLIEILLDKIQKKYKILICVDEAVSNNYMRPFAQTIQLLLRKKYSINLLMTGLYQNIYNLQNNNALTFLYRAPKINLEPLNISAVAQSYKKIFDINYKKALKLALFTKGYSYAYQVLGYLLASNKQTNIDNNILDSFDQFMQEYVYDKIWSELSEKDKDFLFCFDDEDVIKIESVIEKTKKDKKYVSVYRDRLIKKGIIHSVEHGKISLKLPRFNEYIQLQKMIYEIN